MIVALVGREVTDLSREVHAVGLRDLNFEFNDVDGICRCGGNNHVTKHLEQKGKIAPNTLGLLETGRRTFITWLFCTTCKDNRVKIQRGSDAKIASKQPQRSARE